MADSQRVGALLVWSAIATAVVMGFRAGTAGLGVCGAILGIAMQMAGWSRHRRALGLVVVGLALLRGVAIGGPETWRAVRGDAGLRELEVVGATTPGPRCRARVRDPGGGPTAIVFLPPSTCPLAAGDRVRVLARSLRAAESRVPGEWDAGWTTRREQVVTVLTVRHAWRSHAGPDGPSRWIARVRQRAWEESRGDDRLGFLAASTLGARAALAPDRREDLRASGLGHLVAVSGLHVGMAAAAVLALCVRASTLLLGVVWPGVVASWLPIVAYVAVTGGSPPAMRAAVMALVAGVGIVLGRPVNGRLLLLMTGAFLLVLRPGWILDAGFQLSMAAMAAVVSRPRDAGIVGSSWRVAWAIAPFSLWHFGDAVLSGVLANCVAIPVFSLWVLPLSLVGWGLEPFVGVSVLEPAAWGAGLILDLARGVGALPGVPGIVAVSLGLAFVAGEAARGRQLTPRLGVVAATGVLAIAFHRDVPPALTSYVVGTGRSLRQATVDDGGVLRVEPGAEADWWALARAEGLSAVEPRSGPPSSSARARRALARCRGRPGQRVATRIDPAGRMACYRDGLWTVVGQIGWAP